jgi:hypothetical protein
MSHDNIPFFSFHCGESDHSIVRPGRFLSTTHESAQLAGFFNIAETFQVDTYQTSD